MKRKKKRKRKKEYWEKIKKWESKKKEVGNLCGKLNFWENI